MIGIIQQSVVSPEDLVVTIWFKKYKVKKKNCICMNESSQYDQ